MSRENFSPSSHRLRQRSGLTLAELLVASTIMLMIATAVASLAATVHSTNDFCQGYTVAAQHARVTLSRIERAINGVVANEQFPGCLVVAEQAGSQTLPSTLVVWSPTAAAANPSGLPLISELVIFAPDPAHPNVLLEIRAPTQNTTAPAASDTAGWQALTSSLRSDQSTTQIALTTRLRVAPITGDYNETLTPADLRGTIRFRCLMAPSDQEWSRYRAGTQTWQSLAWPLDSYRSTSGTRAVACQTEIQIAPGTMTAAAATAIPFYGSAFFTYELPR